MTVTSSLLTPALQAEHGPRGPWIQTFTGKAFYPLDPRPEEVCIEDIAHALSLQCRFGGHCRCHYSVAQHSILVTAEVTRIVGSGSLNNDKDHLAALLHDAAEAYVVDLPRPLKLALPAYDGVEDVVLEAIGQRFGVKLTGLPATDPIKLADNILLATEKRDVMMPSSEEWGWLPPPMKREIYPYRNPIDAEYNFLAMFKMYEERIKRLQ